MLLTVLMRALMLVWSLRTATPSPPRHHARPVHAFVLCVSLLLWPLVVVLALIMERLMEAVAEVAAAAGSGAVAGAGL